MCVGSSAWGGSKKVPGERRAPPLASTPSHCPPLAMLRTHISLQKKSLDFVWLITYGHLFTDSVQGRLQWQLHMKRNTMKRVVSKN